MDETEIAPALQADIDWYRKGRDRLLREATESLSAAHSYAAKLRSARVQAGVDAEADDGMAGELLSLVQQLEPVVAATR